MTFCFRRKRGGVDCRKEPYRCSHSRRIRNRRLLLGDSSKKEEFFNPFLSRKRKRQNLLSPIPNVEWEDVGALDHLKKELYLSILSPIKHSHDYEKLGIKDELVLLYGPPGCGKTLIAKAVANEAQANFIHVKGSELLNKTALEVIEIFECARESAPCIVFLDEVDALTTKRKGLLTRTKLRRIGLLKQLLRELYISKHRRDYFVIAATDKPFVMDSLLSSRFGKQLYVPLPGPDERALILKALDKKFPFAISANFSTIGRMKACENFTGADLAALMNEASKQRLISNETSDARSKSTFINMSHFEIALSKVSPSVTGMPTHYYQRYMDSLKKCMRSTDNGFCSFTTL